MRGREVLWRIELPLALPLIFAGIRTATVYVIATATLAAIAGGGGLGEIIVSQATYKIEGVIAAAMLVTALAFAAEGFFALLQRAVTPRGLRASANAKRSEPLRRPRASRPRPERPNQVQREKGAGPVRTRSLQGALAALLAGGARARRGGVRQRRRRQRRLGRPARQGQAGGDDRSQGLHRAVHPRPALHAGAARPRATSVTFKQNIGSTEVIDKALTSGKIDMYPEYTGTILSVVAAQTQAAHQRAGGLRRRQEVPGGPRLHAAQHDAVLQLRRDGRDHRLRAEERPEVDRRHQEARREASRGARRRSRATASRA